MSSSVDVKLCRGKRSKKTFSFFKKGVDKPKEMCYSIKAVNAGVAE